jgi:hypothetical protein
MTLAEVAAGRWAGAVELLEGLALDADRNDAGAAG